jgi:hypothetical protein
MKASARSDQCETAFGVAAGCFQADLSDVERAIIEKRLLEQRRTFELQLASTFPLALKL